VRYAASEKPSEDSALQSGQAKRREFITFLGGAIAWVVRTAIAQPLQKLRRVGVLNPESAALAPLPAFVDELRLLGWRDQENVLLDIRSADGRYELVPQLANELIRAQVHVIYTLGPDATLTTAVATKTIPIVAIDLETDPVATGLVEKLGRPGGNLTGLFLDLPEIAGKWLELLGETVLQLSRVGVLGTARINNAQFAAIEAVATPSKYVLRRLNIDDAGYLQVAFDAALQERLQGIVVLPSPLVLGNHARIAALAMERKLPTVFLFAQAAEAGGLIAYGPDVNEMSRRAAKLLIRVLNGAQPAELPIERPTKFELVVNVKTAQALGLAIPPTLLTRADKVIE
jgi:putative tryptophan/tyrosine transport system substrate-binding protein